MLSPEAGDPGVREPRARSWAAKEGERLSQAGRPAWSLVSGLAALKPGSALAHRPSGGGRMREGLSNGEAPWVPRGTPSGTECSARWGSGIHPRLLHASPLSA